MHRKCNLLFVTDKQTQQKNEQLSLRCPYTLYIWKPPTEMGRPWRVGEGRPAERGRRIKSGCKQNPPRGLRIETH